MIGSYPKSNYWATYPTILKNDLQEFFRVSGEICSPTWWSPVVTGLLWWSPFQAIAKIR